MCNSDLRLDLPPGVANNIIEDFAHEQRETDGEIFRKIRLHKNNPTEQAKWRARLSSAKQKDLKQFEQNRAFMDAFDAVVDMPGLWSPLELGTLHRLLPLGCPEVWP